MDGVLVVDKPEGMTSHDVVAVARHCLHERRIGHTGTLDPLATGVLPLACGRATRLVRFLGASTKDYDAAIRFGVTTDSYDITGAETGRTDRWPGAPAVEAALASLRGAYLQTPPAFSAKKVAGRRAYALARGRQPVELAPVPVRVTRATLLRLEDGVGHVAISCSAGFYVRAFAHALGALVGTGACLQALRRTRSGQFTLAEAVTLADLQSDPAAAGRGLVGLDGLLAGMPSVRLTEEGAHRVAHGREVPGAMQTPVTPATGAPEEPAGEPSDWVRMFDRTGHLIAVGRVVEGAAVLHPSVVLI